MQEIQGILFDKDGTLFDFQASWGAWIRNLIHGFAEGDHVRAAALADALGYDLSTGRFLPDSLSIAGTVAEQAAAIAPYLPEITVRDLMTALVEAAACAEMVAVDRLPNILADLRARGLRLGVATNDAESAAHAHLAQAGVADFFDYVAGFDSGHGAKPDPGMCRGFAEALSMDPAQIVMVGDSTHDLLAGRAAGMPVIGVLTGIASEQDLAPYADRVLPDISHLATWLDTQRDETDENAQKTTGSVAI